MIAKNSGIAVNCDHREALGIFANLLKSGALIINAAKLDIQNIGNLTNIQKNSECSGLKSFKDDNAIFPRDLFRDHIKKPKAANGINTTFRVKKCLILWGGTKTNGILITQKIKKHINSQVLVLDDPK